MTADAVGGVWQYATELARGLMPHGWSVDLALLGPGPAPATDVTVIETGLPLDWLAEDPADVAASARAVAQLARGYDAVQLNQPALAIADYPGPLIAVVHSCVATWWAAVEHGPLPPALAWQAALTARGLDQADVVVAPSAAFAKSVARTYTLRQPPMVVHNGRSGAPGRGAGARVFTAGRLWDRGKDVATLDRAAARLSLPFEAAGPLAGPHGERVSVAHLRSLGRLDDAAVAERLAGRPIFASAARYEPFGFAVLEAALAGCALVLSDIPTFRELWDGAATFVAPGDDAGFADAIETLAADTALRTARGTLAATRAATFTPDRMAAGMAAILDRLAPATETQAA
jgi:glycosyltransferase involved in cell wall biosynthesis